MLRVYYKAFTTMDGKPKVRFRVFQGESVDKLEFKGQLFIDDDLYARNLFRSDVEQVADDT